MKKHKLLICVYGHTTHNTLEFIWCPKFVLSILGGFGPSFS